VASSAAFKTAAYTDADNCICPPGIYNIISLTVCIFLGSMTSVDLNQLYAVVTDNELHIGHSQLFTTEQTKLGGFFMQVCGWKT